VPDDCCGPEEQSRKQNWRAMPQRLRNGPTVLRPLGPHRRPIAPPDFAALLRQRLAIGGTALTYNELISEITPYVTGVSSMIGKLVLPLRH
jgi:hypothetical protein